MKINNYTLGIHFFFFYFFLLFKIIFIVIVSIVILFSIFLPLPSSAHRPHRSHSQSPHCCSWHESFVHVFCVVSSPFFHDCPSPPSPLVTFSSLISVLAPNEGLPTLLMSSRNVSKPQGGAISGGLLELILISIYPKNWSGLKWF